MISGFPYYLLVDPFSMSLFAILQNGVLSSLPFIGRFVGAIGSGILADNLMTKELLSVTTTRKIFHASGKSNSR